MQSNKRLPQLTAIYPQQATTTRQGVPYFYGISANTVGATGLSMHLVEIPPGGKAEPHSHQGFETAIYVLAGRLETHYSEGLCQSVVNGAGSFLFIPPGVPHQPINLSSTQPALAIIARNNAQEQEEVTHYPLPR
jgi:uncharacterized RmlC-like cupin family protein